MSTPTPTPPRRPRTLTFALALVWLVGLVGGADGCQTIETLRHPELARAAAEHLADPRMQELREAVLSALLAARGVVTPTAVASMLLGTALTLAAAMVALGHARARSFLLQALAAYALFLPTEYVLRRPLRAMLVDALAVAAPQLPASGLSPEEVDHLLRATYGWVWRGMLGGQLAILALGAYAVTRPAARAFLDAAQAERARAGGG